MVYVSIKIEQFAFIDKKISFHLFNYLVKRPRRRTWAMPAVYHPMARRLRYPIAAAGGITTSPYIISSPLNNPSSFRTA